MTGVTVLQTIDGGIDAATNTTSRTATFTSNVTSTGSVLLAHVSTFNTSPANISISDTAGNSWILIGSVYDNNSRGAGAWYCRANAGSVGTKPVVTFSKGSSCGIGCSIMEVTPDATTVLDVVPVTANAVTTGPAQVTLGATSYTNDLVVAVLGIEQAAWVTCTPLTNYTNVISDTSTPIALQHIVQTRATTTAAAFTPGWTLTASSHWNIVAYALRGTTSAPTITGVNTATPNYLGALTVNGVNFGSSTGSLTLGGVTQTTTAWADTSITISSLSRGSNQYGVAENLIATTSTSVSSNTYTGVTSLLPQNGWSYVNLGTPNSTSANRITAVADLASGDQLAYNNSGGLVTVLSDATFSADMSVTTFNVEAWSTGNGWGSTAAQTVGNNPVAPGAVGIATISFAWFK